MIPLQNLKKWIFDLIVYFPLFTWQAYFNKKQWNNLPIKNNAVASIADAIKASNIPSIIIVVSVF